MKRPKRVLMVTPRYTPSIGGVEKHVQEVIEQLSARGTTCDVLTISHEIGLPRRAKVKGHNVSRIPFGWDRNPFLIYIWIVVNRRRFDGYDIVHVHDPVPLLFWYLPMVLLRPFTPVYVTFHGFEHDPVLRIFILLRRIAARAAKGVICIGRFMERIYGVSCDLQSVGAVESTANRNAAGQGAVFVGRIEQDTGIMEHIEALSILRSKHEITLPLTVCGMGSMRKRIEETAKTKGVVMEILGFVENPIEVMTRNSICLAAGYLSILEAMSVGLPAIGVATSPLKMAYLKSMRESGAPISIQTTPEGIAEETVRVLNDAGLRRSLSTRGRAFAAKMTWKKMADLYIELWSKHI